MEWAALNTRSSLRTMLYALLRYGSASDSIYMAKREPFCAELQEVIAPRLREVPIKFAVQTQLQRRCAFAIHWHKIARNANFLEGVVFLELADGPGSATAVMEIRHAPAYTDFNGLCDKGIVGCFVTVADHRHNIHEVRNPMSVDKLDEANQFFMVVCPEKLTLR